MNIIEEKINYETCKQTFLEFTDLLNKLNIPFRLAYGTLLGAIREKDFIKGDTDIDFIVPYESREKILKVKNWFELNGFKIIRDWDFLITFKNKGNTIDLYFFKQRNIIDVLLNRVTIKQGWWGAYLNKKYFDKWFEIPFCDKKFYTIGYPTEWLCKMYGQDWFIPKSSKGNSRLWTTNFIQKHKKIEVFFEKIMKVND
jgi:lipopolysaccharide cholinephosphotransferase